MSDCLTSRVSWLLGWPEAPQVVGGNRTGWVHIFIRAKPSWQKHFRPPAVCVDWLTIEWLASPPCWLWWFSIKQNGYPLSRQSFGKKNEQKKKKGWEIKLTSRVMFTREKHRREGSHSGAFVSLVQPGSAAHMHWGRWLNTRYWNETKRRRKKKLKARQIIGFGSAWTWVCVLSNAAVFAQLERVPRVISAGSRVWHCRAQLQNKPAEESLGASLSRCLSCPFQKQAKTHRTVYWLNTISAMGRCFLGAHWPGSCTVLAS